MRMTTIVNVCLLSLSAGCMPAPVGSTGPQTVRSAEQADSRGPFVPAGTSFSVRLDRALDTMTSLRTEPFTAVVVEPVRDMNGNVVVPAGGRVYGQVQSVVGATGVPRLRLRFDAIDSIAGQAPLQVRVAGADQQTYRGPIPATLGPPILYDSFDGSYAGPYGGGPATPWIAYGPYSAYDFTTYIPREVHVAEGATMNLVLTRPLFAPAASTIPR